MQGRKLFEFMGIIIGVKQCQNVYIGHGNHLLPDKVSGDKT
jgi:hypothetical protein